MPVERSDDVWDRLGWLWGAFYGLMLAVAATLSATSLEGSAARRLVPVAGAVALLVLERVADRLVGPGDVVGRRALAIGLGWYAGSLALLVPLVQTSDFFGLALYGFLPRVFALLPERTGVAAAVAVVPVLLVGQGGTSVLSEPDAWASAVGSGVLSVVIGYFIFRIARQSAERRQALADLTAAQAEAQQQARRAGAAEERARLAREIHDTLAQGLVSVLTQLEAADNTLAREPAAAGRHLDLARQAARAALADARRSVQALRPPTLQEAASLPAAIERIAQRWSAESGVPATVSVVGADIPLAPEVEVTLLRAAQEGLANVARHARAGRATVTLSYDGDEVAVDVDDDGVGFRPDALPARDDGAGFGIEALRQRAAALGGTAHVESEPGRGSTLVLRVPAHPAVEVPR